jgi:hypothetical protein
MSIINSGNVSVKCLKVCVLCRTMLLLFRRVNFMKGGVEWLI